jgi:hypothetical protein
LPGDGGRDNRPVARYPLDGSGKAMRQQRAKLLGRTP